MKPVKLKHNGIKCDYCDWKDETVEREDFELLINKPCPKCGENLLTYRDYQNVLILEAIVEATNEEMKDLPEDNSERKSFYVDTHNGLTFSEKPNKS